jgi:hypothetical protein
MKWRQHGPPKHWFPYHITIHYNPEDQDFRLRMFENKVLRRISGSRKKEVAGDQRRLFNEELHSLYSSPNIIRVVNSRKRR